MAPPSSSNVWSEIRERATFVVVVALTTAWAVIVLAYLSKLGASALMQLPVGDMAALLVAISAPVVGLWLVAGVLGQRHELASLRRRLGEITSQARNSMQHTEVQSRAILEMESQLKRSAAAGTRTLVLQDLAAQAAIVGERLGIMKSDAIDMAWARFGSGDVGAFVQPLISYQGQHPDLAERMGDAVVRDHPARAALTGFIRRYDRLIAALADDKLAQETLEEGPLGRAVSLFRTAEARAQSIPADAANPAGEASA
ncbi:MAG: hypothetical protein EXR11_01150 [Rhodospirillaceae bacterium]|nr:hypothetical protein [Rhodospirillaceae bacterium]